MSAIRNLDRVRALSAGRSLSVVVALAATAQIAVAQRVPLREVARPDAVTVDRFRRIASVRPLADGRLLINDAGRRELVAVDRNLLNPKVVLDSSSRTQGYGMFEASLVPYLGDSLALVSRSALSVLDARGQVVRWVSSATLPLLTLIRGGNIGHDGAGNFVVSASTGPARPATPATSDAPARPATPGLGSDSGLVANVNFWSRAVKPVARLQQQPIGRMSMDRAPDGRMVARTVLNVLPLYDEYVVLSDGTTAVVRAVDYHIDFVKPNGQVESSPKIPFAFTSLTIADRQAVIDSSRAAQVAAEAAGIQTREREGAAVMTGVAVARATGLNGTKPGEGFKVNVEQTGSVATGNVTANPGQAVQGSMPFAMRAADLEYVPAAELPPFTPAFKGRGVSVDSEDNIWIRTTAADPSRQNATVYDVVNRNGALVERVRIPAGRTVAGFGPNGTLYLTVLVDDHMLVERAAVRR